MFEGLHNVILLPEDCYATCGTCLLRLNCLAMDEGSNAGCTIHVSRRLRGGARAGGKVIGSIPWQCNVWCAGPTDVGLPDSVGVFDLGAPSSTPSQVVLQHMSLRWFLVAVSRMDLGGGSSPSPGALLVPGLVCGPLGKAPAPKGSKAPPTARAAGFTSPAPQAPSSWCWCVFQPSGPSPYLPRCSKGLAAPPPSPQPGPSLVPSEASLMDALALLSNVLSPSEVDRLRKLVGHLPCTSRRSLH